MCRIFDKKRSWQKISDNSRSLPVGTPLASFDRRPPSRFRRVRGGVSYGTVGRLARFTSSDSTPPTTFRRLQLPPVADTAATCHWNALAHRMHGLLDAPAINLAGIVVGAAPDSHQRLAEGLARFREARVIVSYYDHSALPICTAAGGSGSCRRSIAHAARRSRRHPRCSWSTGPARPWSCRWRERMGDRSILRRSEPV